jgi:hypothetical protein
MPVLIENRVLEEIERELMVQYQMERPIFDILPWVEENASAVAWSIRDDVLGLLPVVGHNDPLPQTDLSGRTEFFVQPHGFGEKFQLDAERMARMGAPGQYGGPQPPSLVYDVMAEEMRDRHAKCWNTASSVGWQLLSAGSALALDRNGNSVQVANWAGLPTGSAGVPWATLATATPVKDIINTCVERLDTGHNFAAGRVYARSKTWQTMLYNTNPNDLAGKRMPGLSTIITLKDVNNLYAGQIPELVEIDSFYKDASGATVWDIPEGVLIFVGQNPVYGLKAGQMVSTLLGGRPGGPKPGLYVGMSWPDETGSEYPYLPRGEFAVRFGPRVNYGKQVFKLTAYTP